MRNFILKLRLVLVLITIFLSNCSSEKSVPEFEGAWKSTDDSMITINKVSENAYEVKYRKEMLSPLLINDASGLYDLKTYKGDIGKNDLILMKQSSLSERPDEFDKLEFYVIRLNEKKLYFSYGVHEGAFYTKE
jgi:hypothetical protein